MTDHPDISQPFGFHTVAYLNQFGAPLSQAHAVDLMALNEVEERFRQHHWSWDQLYRSDLNRRCSGEYLIMDALCAAKAIFNSFLPVAFREQLRHPDKRAGDGGIQGMATKLRTVSAQLEALGRDYQSLQTRVALESPSRVLVVQALDKLRHRTFLLREELKKLSCSMDSFESGDRCGANTLCQRWLLSLTALHRKCLHVSKWDFITHGETDLLTAPPLHTYQMGNHYVAP